MLWLGKRRRVEQRNSASSLGSNLLFGSGPTARSWSPNAWASWKGRWHQSPRGLPSILIPKPGELQGPHSECPLLPSEGAPFLICVRALYGQRQLTHTPAASSGCGKPTMTILEPSAPWSAPRTSPEVAVGLCLAGRRQDSPGSAPHHWSVLWSRRSWDPPPSKASARRPFCSHFPISPGSARERWPGELCPHQGQRSKRDRGCTPFLPTTTT